MIVSVILNFQLKYPLLQKKLIMSLLNRITISPNICHGKPCIRGMRWPVEVVIDMLGSEMTIDEILDDHPELERADILACLQFAQKMVTGESISLAA